MGRSHPRLRLLFKTTSQLLKVPKGEQSNTDNVEAYNTASRSLVSRVLKRNFNLIQTGLNSGENLLIYNTLDLLTACSFECSYNCNTIWERMKWSSNFMKSIFGTGSLSRSNNGSSSKEKNLRTAYTVFIFTLLRYGSSNGRSSIIDSEKIWAWNSVVRHISEIEKSSIINHVVSSLKQCAMDKNIDSTKKGKLFTTMLLKELLNFYNNHKVVQEVHDLMRTVCCTPHSGVFSGCIEWNNILSKSVLATKRRSITSNISLNSRKLLFILNLLRPSAGCKKQDLIVCICAAHSGLISQYFSLHKSLIFNMRPGPNESWFNFSSLIARIINLNISQEDFSHSVNTSSCSFFTDSTIPSIFTRNTITAAFLHANEVVKYSISVVLCYAFFKLGYILKTLADEDAFGSEPKFKSNPRFQIAEAYINSFYNRLPDFQVIIAQLLSPKSDSQSSEVRDLSINQRDRPTLQGNSVMQPAENLIPRSLKAILFKLVKYYLVYCPLKSSSLHFNPKKLYNERLDHMDGEIALELLDIVIITSASGKWHVKPLNMNSSVLEELLKIHVTNHHHSSSHYKDKAYDALKAVLENSPPFENRRLELDIFLNLLRFFRYARFTEDALSWLSVAVCTGMSKSNPKITQNSSEAHSLNDVQDPIIEFLGNAIGSLLRRYCKEEKDLSFVCAIVSWASNYFCCLIICNLITADNVNLALEKISIKFLSGTPPVAGIQLPLKLLQRAANFKKSNFYGNNLTNKIIQGASLYSNIQDMETPVPDIELECDETPNSGYMDNLFRFVHERCFEEIIPVFKKLLIFASNDRRVWELVQTYVLTRHPLEGSIFTNLFRLYGRVHAWPELVRKFIFNAHNISLLVNIYAAAIPSVNEEGHLRDVVTCIVDNMSSSDAPGFVLNTLKIISVNVKSIENNIAETSLFIFVLERLVEKIRHLNIIDCDFRPLFSDEFLLNFLFLHLDPSCVCEVRTLSISLASVLKDIVLIPGIQQKYACEFKTYIKRYQEDILRVIKQDMITPHIQRAASLAVDLGIKDVFSLLSERLCSREIIDLIGTYLFKNTRSAALSLEFLKVDEVLYIADGGLSLDILSAWLSDHKLRLFGVSTIYPSSEDIPTLWRLKIYKQVALNINEVKIYIQIPFKPSFNEEFLRKVCGAAKISNQKESLYALLMSGVFPLSHVGNQLLNCDDISTEILAKVTAIVLNMRSYRCYFDGEEGMKRKHALIAGTLRSYIASSLRMCLGLPGSRCVNTSSCCSSYMKTLVSSSPYFFAKEVLPEQYLLTDDTKKAVNALGATELSRVCECLSHYYDVFTRSFSLEHDVNLQISLVLHAINTVERVLELFTNGEERKDFVCAFDKLLFVLCNWCKSDISNKSWTRIVSSAVFRRRELSDFVGLFLEKLLEYGDKNIKCLELMSHLCFWLFEHVPSNANTANLDPSNISNMILGHPTFNCMLAAVESSITKNERNKVLEEGMTYLLDALNFSSSSDYLNIYNKDYTNSVMRIYGGTQSPLDVKILECLFVLESRGHLSVYEYIMTWRNMHKMGHDYTLKSLDPVLMSHTIEYFDPLRDLEYPANEGPMNHDLYSSHLTNSYSKHISRVGASLYDPRFFIPLATIILQNGKESELRRSLLLLQSSNILGLAVICCSSLSYKMREAGYFFLDLYRHYISNSTTSLELSQINLVLDSLRRTVGIESGNRPRMQRMTSFFISQSLSSITKPESFMYKPLNNFFLRRPIIDLGRIQIFNEIIVAASDDSRQQRLWIFHILSCGLSCIDDYENYAKKNILNTFISAYDSPFCDVAMKKLVLLLFHDASNIPDLGSNILKTTSLAFFLESEFQIAVSRTKYDTNLASTITSIILNLSRNLRACGIEGTLLGQTVRSCIVSLCKALDSKTGGQGDSRIVRYNHQLLRVTLNLAESTLNILMLHDKCSRSLEDFSSSTALLFSISRCLGIFFSSEIESTGSRINNSATSEKIYLCQIMKVLMDIISSFGPYECSSGCETTLGTLAVPPDQYSDCYILKSTAFCLSALEILEYLNSLNEDICLLYVKWINGLLSQWSKGSAQCLLRDPQLLSNFVGLCLKLQLSGFDPIWQKVYDTLFYTAS